jgi:biopolymer transport protein ExbB
MPVDFNWLRAMGASPVFLVLVGCSVVTLAVTIERLLYFARRRGDPDTTLRSALAEIGLGELRAAVRTCQASPHPFGQVAQSLFRDGEVAEGMVEQRLAVALSEQKILLERNLLVIGTMAAIAPLVGLLGTVWGIMRAFHDMALVGSAGPSVVAAGIAEALFTSAAGIMIAVPSLVLYNHLARRMATMLMVAENHAQTLRVALSEMIEHSPRSAGTPSRSETRDARHSAGRANEPIVTR